MDRIVSEVLKVSAQATQQEVADIVASFKQGQSIDGLLLLDAAEKIDDLVEQGALITKPLILGDDLLFVQPDGTIIGLLDGAKANVALTAENLTIPVENIIAVALQQGAWTTIADAVEVDLAVLSTTIPASLRGSGEETPVLPGDPLNGLPVSPLLPPTDYQFPELRDRDVGDDGGIGEANLLFSVDPVLLVEVDTALGLRLSDFIRITAGNGSQGEEVETVTVSLPNLPLGTTANGGSFTSDGTTSGFTFSGSLAAFNALVISFPQDFSTERRTDVASGDLTGSVTATSTFIGSGVAFDFPVTVLPEGDLEFVSTGNGRQPETDAPVDFILSEVLTPRASDRDGSEEVTSVALDLVGLPAGALLSTDGGQTFAPVPADYSFAGTLAEYEQLQVRLPADFSTTNPATTIAGTLRATTDEGADQTGTFELAVDATPDIVITPPAAITVDEDGDGVDGGGVTVDLGLNIFVEDTDGSEDATTVEIAFTDLPANTVFNTGSFSVATGIWTGTMAEANALTLGLPGDYSGSITSVITATNIEGSQTATQDIVVNPAPDVDVTAPDLIAVETDAPLVIRPAGTWEVSVSDGDGGTPPEVLQSITLTLNDLPPGVIVQNAQAATVVYDPALGGTFTFIGTPADYELLTLVFPEDYSTQNAGLPNDALTGDILGVSSEGTGSAVPVRLIIGAEGDATLDVLPLAPLEEQETGQTLRLGQLLEAQVTDLDGSESIASIVVEITGLPSVNFDLSDTSGFPAGSVSLITAADGTQTLQATFSDANVADVRAAFDAATFVLPADFSTENRSDLSGGTTLPIAVRATLTTNEDNDLSTDGPSDGQVTAEAFVTVAAVDDIELTLPITITAQEDNGIENNADGVRVPMQIDIAITDDDGSETETPGTPFSATVSIEFTDLPAGATLTTGILTGTTWTGSVADARALAIDFPGNYAGNVLANVTVATPEGVKSSPTAIVVTPTPDVNITGTITGTETDDPLTLVLSDFIDLAIDPVNETLFSLDLTLPGLPAGTVAVDANGTPVGTLTADGTGTFTYTFDFNATSGSSVDLNDIRLVFPADFSTENPDIPLSATLLVSTVTGNFPPSTPVTATIDVVIQPEGDVEMNVVGAQVLSETDAPVDFKPSDYLSPNPTDADGSESIDKISVTFNDLPPGTTFSTDGVTFTPAPFDLGFTGSLAEYNALIVRLPADYSTQSPAETLTGTVIATTDEFGSATGTFDIVVEAEGDLTIIGNGTLSLTENDAPGTVDLDNTTQAAQVFRLADAATAVASDADGSETITGVMISLSDLPAGAQVSLDGGATFGPALAAGGFALTRDSIEEFERVFIRLPDDFSTQRAEGAITGTLTFTTDESVLNGEALDTPGSGNLSQAITIEVAPEGDVRIAGFEPVVAEDTGTPIDLGLAAFITDIDGSETLTGLTVTFDGLPAVGQTVLSDGTVLSGRPGANVWTGSTLSDLTGLSIASLPEHFSGIVTMTTTVVTNETGPAGQSDTFVLQVTPVAEPEITLSLDTGAAAVTEVAPDQFAVKEDNSFLLQIDANTPDRDGSETLRDIVIENIPQGWVQAGDGPVDLTLFEGGRADIASAEITGTTLTIALNPGVTSFAGGLRVTPFGDDDRDVDTLTAGDFQATVTAVDTATGLASNTATARDTIDVDVDAVVDGIDFAFRNRSTNENVNGQRIIDAGITNLGLRDSDGSETLDAVAFTLTMNTLSDNFDPAVQPAALLNFRSFDARVKVTQSDNIAGDNAVTFTVARADGASSAEFAEAIEVMRLVLPQHFSGRAILNGEVRWSETRTGDAEADTADNFNAQPFQTVLTVRPLAEAVLDAGVFVLPTDSDFVTDGTLRVEQVVTARGSDQSVVDPGTLTLQESTSDSTGFGQVQAFLKLGASTLDTDGSEALTTLVVSNIPSSWIGVTETTSNVTLDRSMFFSLDGTAQIDPSEFDKLDGAAYNASTGKLTLTFAPDVTSFAGAVAIYPALYEDYDVDRANGDSFSDDGNFFGADLNFALRTVDGNTVTTVNRNADLTVDVDVDPINNEAFVVAFRTGNEAVVDAAGGVLQFDFVPLIRDVDGSETIISTVLRDVPDYLTVYAPPPNDPTGVKVPALLTSINGDGTLDWSLNMDQWLGVEFRGVPKHFSGDIPIEVAIVTNEANGVKGVTNLTSVTISIDPVADGGDPSEVFQTREDTAVQIFLDGNIIDLTPESPERVLDAYTIFDVQPDSEGRFPQFFDGAPNQVGTTAAGDPVYDNLLSPNATGGYDIDDALAGNLFVLPGQDSNENVVFKVEMTYEEVNDATATRKDVGTVTINVQGVADAPLVGGQDPDPALTPGGIDKALIDPVYLPGDTVGGVANADRAYAYAGFDDVPFQLTQRLSDAALQTDFASVADPFTAAERLSADRTEITFADGGPDGSETLYYIVTGIPADIRFIGGTPVDATGETYLVTEAQLANLTVVGSPVTEVTYYDMQLNAFVIENDQDLSGVPQFGPGVSVDDVLNAIDALTGGSLTTTDFSIMMLPSGNPGGGGMVCPPDDPRMLPIPELSLVGEAFEDTANELRIAITADAPFWSSIADLSTLPNGVVGDFGLGLRLPDGATLTSSTPGAVIYDPISGQYAIDFAKLGVDPANPLQTAGTVTYTPPPHQSSPVNPFTPAETLGTADPYDSLADIQTVAVLNNFTCNEFLSDDTGTLPLTVLPVADGPQIAIAAPVTVDEDTEAALDITLSSEDGGERITGDVLVAINGDPGARLFRGGAEILPDAGTGPGTGVAAQFTLSPADITGLSLRATEHFSGDIAIAVTATTEDIDGSTQSATSTQVITIEPVVDEAEFVYSTDTTPTGTGLPLVNPNPSGGPEPLVIISEDTVATFGDIFDVAQSPDQDGSETASAVVGPLPDFVVLGGAAGIIDNGDGTFTVPAANLAALTIALSDEHARTPDSLDTSIPAQIRVDVSINSLELGNSDEARGDTSFFLQVLPDADKPSVVAEIAPMGGTEDDGTQYAINLSGTTPDPHETVSFELTLPGGGELFLDGVPVAIDANGLAMLPGRVDPAYIGSGAGFVVDGVVTYVPPADFAGDVSIEAVAVSADGPSDTENSDFADLQLSITPSPDLDITIADPALRLPETDAPIVFSPASNVTLVVTDSDLSEVITGVTFQMTGLPAGTTFVSNGTASLLGGTLNFSGSEADFASLQITLPADFATNGAALPATVSATTNELGSVSENFTLEVLGELDATLAVNGADLAQIEGSDLTVALGLDAQVTDTQATPSETLESILITFDNELPPGTTASSGDLSADRKTLVFARNALSPSDFALAIAALSLTVPASFAGDISGLAALTTNHGTTADTGFDITVNARPVVSGPVEVVDVFNPTITLSFADLYANATDADALTIENITSPDPLVQILVAGQSVTLQVPPGYVGTPLLEYEIVDTGPVPARSSATATVEFDALQMQDSGTSSVGPDGITRALMTDVTGDPALDTVAKGTNGDDFVNWDATARPYAGITEFQMLEGSDLVDLTGATTGFTVDGGAGNDILLGSSGNDILRGGADDDILEGGAGFDELFGGAGSDIFVLASGPVSIADSIGDFGAGDQIDLSKQVSGVDDITGLVSYDSGTGALAVNGTTAFNVQASGGGIPASVEVIFEDSAGAAQTAVV